MTKAYQTVCGDLPGHEGCSFVIRSADEREIVRLVQQHARRVHEEMLGRDDVRGILQQVEA